MIDERNSFRYYPKVKIDYNTLIKRCNLNMNDYILFIHIPKTSNFRYSFWIVEQEYIGEKPETGLDLMLEMVRWGIQFC
jgi:hypothetical protein